jgi:hypothetical protein
MLLQGGDVKEVAAAAQQAAAAAAEAHRNIQSLWSEVGQLRGRQGQMDRRLDDLWQVKVRSCDHNNAVLRQECHPEVHIVGWPSLQVSRSPPMVLSLVVGWSIQ